MAGPEPISPGIGGPVSRCSVGGEMRVIVTNPTQSCLAACAARGLRPRTVDPDAGRLRRGLQAVEDQPEDPLGALVQVGAGVVTLVLACDLGGPQKDTMFLDAPPERGNGRLAHDERLC